MGVGCCRRWKEGSALPLFQTLTKISLTCNRMFTGDMKTEGIIPIIDLSSSSWKQWVCSQLAQAPLYSTWQAKMARQNEELMEEIECLWGGVCTLEPHLLSVAGAPEGNTQHTIRQSKPSQAISLPSKKYATRKLLSDLWLHQQASPTTISQVFI
jgi:hypothetical protein